MHRTSERVPFGGTVALCRERTPRLVQSENIGAGGICLRTDEPLDVRSLLTVRITMPDGGGFTVMGRVVHRQGGSSGVEFLDLMPRDHARLRRYVDANVQRRRAG